MPIKTVHLANYWHERSGGIATFYRQPMDAANRFPREFLLPESKGQRILADERPDPPS